MDITLNNAPHSPEPVITHRDYHPKEECGAEGFSCVTIVMGADTITIFLPFGGRLSYTNQNKE